MWFGYEEDSPTNKAKSLGSLPPFIKGAIAPSTTRTRARVCTRARVHAHTRTRARAGAQTCTILDINAQGDTTGKNGDFFEKPLTKPFFYVILWSQKKMG